MHTKDSLEALCPTRATTPRGGARCVPASSPKSPGAGFVCLALSRPLSRTTRSLIVATLVSFGIRATFKAFAPRAIRAPNKPRKTTPHPKQGRTGGRLMRSRISGLVYHR